MSPPDPAVPSPDLLSGVDPARLRSVLERVVHDGIVLLGPGGRLEYANDPARRLLSDEDAVIERTMANLSRRIAHLEDGPPHRMEIRTPEGTRTICVDPAVVDEDERQGRLFVLKDARAVDALQEDLYLANRMRGLGELYVSMAHDLKTPINAMTLTLDALRDSLVEGPSDETDESRLEYVDTVRDELTRFHRSIQAFLTQTSPPSDARRRFDMRRLVREVLRFATPLAETRDVRLRTDTTSPVLVRGYRHRLRQALLNIVVNAVEASPPGGEVRIVTRAEKEWVRLNVLDDGPGIASELEDRLFKMHFTTKPKGSGIGLFVARAAVVAHGGRIRIRNRSGGGAEVEIRLPGGDSEGGTA